MPDVVNIYVRGDNNGNYAGMTKEEILAAITQAISGGTIGDIDTGFVTKIKEQNRGQGLMFWVGTTAEYEALAEKPNNVLYIKTDDTSAADINNAISALQSAVTELTETVGGKAPTNHASASDQYGKGTTSVYGHLMLTSESGTVGGHWDDSSTYNGKAVSGTDGADFDARIKQNASNIAEIQAVYKIPVGAIMISDTLATAAAWTSAVGYGEWELAGTGQITAEGSPHTVYYFKRTD